MTFDQLCERRRILLKYVQARVRFADDAEDIVQQVYLKAWQAWPRYYHLGGNGWAWLKTIADNLIRNRARDARHAPLPLEDYHQLATGSPEQEALVRVQLASVAALVRTLPAQQRQGVAEAALGYPHTEATKSALFRARRILREYYS